MSLVKLRSPIISDLEIHQRYGGMSSCIYSRHRDHLNKLRKLRRRNVSSRESRNYRGKKRKRCDMKPENRLASHWEQSSGSIIYI